MNSRAVIAMFVVMLPVSCLAQSIGEQGLPLCDISRPDKASVNVITDTKGVDLGPYLETVKRQVKQGWYSLIPASAVFKRCCVSIQFKILQNGNVADLHYKSTSGDSQLDRAASGGILSVDSLPPLPAGFKGDHLDLRFNFFYNVGPDATSHNPHSQITPAIDEAALAPSSPVHGSTQDFARIADSVNLAYLNALSTNSDAPSTNPSDDSQIVPGRLVHKVDPTYPKEARKNKTQGMVVLEATVEKNGNVTNQSIVSGDLVLADAAVDAVRNWRFEPYTKSGQPVQVHQKLAFEFRQGKKVGELEEQLPPATASKPFGSLPTKGSDEETIFQVGHGVKPPRAIYAPDPPYDEQARRAKYQGTCVLSLIVGSDGQPRDIRVIRALGEGLDAKAVETVSKWKFQPGTKDGVPLAVYVVIEVQFHLY